jgi:AcrR family transcriptional regulator
MTSTPARSYDSTGRLAAAEERRRRVVEVARELFLTDGYGPTSIATIAEAAGVSAPTVYAVFGSKAGILHAVVDVAVAGDFEEGLVRDREEVTTVSAASDAAEWIRLGAWFTRVVHERSAAVLHLVTSVAGADPAVAELLAQATAGRRGDMALTAKLLPGMRRDLTHEDLVDTVDTLTHWEVWWNLVEVAGWSPDRFEAWLAAVVAGYVLEDPNAS